MRIYLGKRKSASKIVLIIAVGVFVSLPLLALAVGIGIIPQGGTFTPIQGQAPQTQISGTDCTKYSGVKLTAYWTPDNWADYGNRPRVRDEEGGPNDHTGKRNHTLFEYIAGKYTDPTKPLEQYVSLSGDNSDGSPFSKYGTKVYIPSIEQAVNHGNEIIFRVVDTGSAFKGKSTTKLDVAVFKESEMGTSALNIPTDIWVGEGCKHGALTSG